MHHSFDPPTNEHPWAPSELKKVLYQGKYESIIHEYHMVNDQDPTQLQVSNYFTPNSYLIVEFYAPWCPHCRHSVLSYIDLAEQLKSKLQGLHISFHAVSCELYPKICRNYKISGYPTFLGYKYGHDEWGDLRKRGVDLKMSLKEISATLELNITTNSTHTTTTSTANKEDTATNTANKKDITSNTTNKEDTDLSSILQHKTQRLQLTLSMMNITHNAAQSFLYALDSLYTTPLTPKRTDTIHQFLQLCDWTIPLTWDLRTLIDTLLENVDVPNEEDLHSLIQRQHSNSIHIRRSHTIEWTWNTPCDVTNGYTCGLWSLFHILTLGSSRSSNEQYGLSKGYNISQSNSAYIIKEFIHNILQCDECRSHFVKMYDNCGHHHCTTLSNDYRNNTDERAFVIWLWEVHNGINVRLLKEEYDQQNIKMKTMDLFLNEVLYPTREICPDCWHNSMMSYSKEAVYQFLMTEYWGPITRNTNNFHDSNMRIHRIYNNDKYSDAHIYNLHIWIIVILFFVIYVSVIRRKCISSKMYLGDYRRGKQL